MSTNVTIADRFDGVDDLLNITEKNRKIVQFSYRNWAHNWKNTKSTVSKHWSVLTNVMIAVISVELLNSINQSEAELQKFNVRVIRL